MPGELDPSHTPADAVERLDGAIARWNARANVAYLDTADLIGAVQQEIESLAAHVAARRELLPTLLLDKARATGPGAAAALAQLPPIEDALAGVHIELQTLHAQVRRAIEACIGLKECTRTLLAADPALRAGGAPGLPEASVTVPVRTAREAQLSSLVDTLRSEVLRVKSELSDTRAQLAAQAAVPQQAQGEIARLRARVLELMAMQDVATSVRRDLSVQYEQILAEAQDNEGRRRRMGEILVGAGVLTSDQLDTALREQQTSWNRHLGAVLVDLGYVNEDIVAQTLAAQIGVPYVRLIHDKPTPEALRLLSRALAHHHSCVPLRFERDTLVVAMANPLDLVAIDDIELATRRSIKPVVASASEIKAALKESYR